MARALAIALLVGGTLACASAPVPPPIGDDVPEPDRCRAPVEGAVLAELSTDECPWRVVGDGAWVHVGSLDSVPRDAAMGRWPLGCPVATCRFEIEDTEHGRVLLVEAAGVGSEAPAGRWLGVLSPDGALDFLDLFAGGGEPDRIDGTEAGPAHALGAAVCEGGVRLEVRARLAGTAGVEPPEELVARAGDYRWEGPALVRSTAPLSACRPVVGL